jgi:hypothetical protein
MVKLKQPSKMQGHYKTTIKNNYPNKKVKLTVNRKTRIRIRKV